jgi:hypothetical protein
MKYYFSYFILNQGGEKGKGKKGFFKRGKGEGVKGKGMEIKSYLNHS